MAIATQHQLRGAQGARRARSRVNSGYLPVAVSSFIGRQRELAELAGLTTEPRLVMLAGPGGSGNTRPGLRVHVSNIEGKLGAASRIEIVTMAHREGLMQAPEAGR